VGDKTVQKSRIALSLNILPQPEQPPKLTLRVNIMEANDKSALSGGAQVSTRVVSATAVKVLFGQFSQVLNFPVPIDSSNLKTRIARKSAYIEAVTSIADRATLRCSVACLFPISLGKRAIHLTNMHRVNLDALPVIDFGDSSRDTWVTTLASVAFSDQERNLRNNNSKDLLVVLKDNLLSLMATASGAQNVKTSVFGIYSSLGGVDTLLFVNEVRLDKSTSSIVADVCVLPMTEKLLFVPTIQEYLRKITTKGTMHTIHTEDVSGEAWKQLLPIFVERCRTWSHRSDCKYSVECRVPLTLLHSEIPICGCGQGLALGSFNTVNAWRGLEPFVTRAAIGLLYTSSHLDTTMTIPESEHDRKLT